MTDKPKINPNFRWTANEAGQLTTEAQQVLRGIVDTLFSRTGGATSSLVTGTAGAADELVKWDANGDIVTVGNAAAARTLISAQQSDALLTAIAALTTAAGGFIRTTGSDTVAAQAIVGTVSQSGGTPSGALQEYGSNGNGDYARFASGLQVCWNSQSTSTSTTWTFPAAFASAPDATATAEAIARGAFIDTIGTTSLTFGRFNTSTGGAVNGTVRLLAMGKWF